ncbi:aspartokinase [Arenicella chitinivorans]|uniref:Aspartokinase n=1 Tax=Arenicella chitinivorans TaxID=1329800 RepID=A0A918VN79_9GAMM|nr:aspartate kinase [Arenicella chitinivorans]GHA09449.1 aspartokinase [Arenicella chitinivorans]
MTLIVEKFGGTSVGSVERINAVADHLIKKHSEGEKLVVVVSAMSGETNRLIGLARQLTEQPSPREMDVLVSTGEQVTIALLSMALHARGIDARSYTGGQVTIRTDNVYSRARITDIDSAKIRHDLDKGRIVVVAGFQGVDSDGNITTLGRGGSDTTAVAIAAAIRADECRIYTDVDGIYTTDPRVVPQARRLDSITAEEMLELASLGAKVLQTRSVEFAGKYKIPLRVLSSFVEGPGTLITYEEEGTSLEAPLISGIAFQRDEAKLTIRGIPDHPGIAHAVLGPISDAHINVDVIIQNASEKGLTDLTFTVPRGDYAQCMEILSELVEELGAQDVKGDDKIAKVSIVGVGMRSHSGVANTMFKTLSDQNINIQMISTSEIKVSVIIHEDKLDLAVQSLHEAFNLARKD